MELSTRCRDIVFRPQWQAISSQGSNASGARGISLHQCIWTTRVEETRQAVLLSIGRTTDLPIMKHFLNYVMFIGDAVPRNDIPVIQRCLESRSPLAEGGAAPVWGYHETFHVG